MSLKPEVIDAMLAAGLTREQMAAVIKAQLVATQQEELAEEEGRLSKNREGNKRRQAAWRERQRQGRNADRNAHNANNGRNVVTDRDPSPKDNNQTPTHEDSPSDPEGSSAPKGARKRGSRIPDDFAESPEARAACVEWGHVDRAADEVLAEFCDFWRAVPGAKGLKLDWLATLRNRLREIGRRPPPRQPRDPTGGQRQPPASTRDLWAAAGRESYENLQRKRDEQRGFDLQPTEPASPADAGWRDPAAPVRERAAGQLVQLQPHGDRSRRRALG